MTVLSRQQALDLAIKAGFSAETARIIVAIATAESGLNTQARNTTGNHPPSTDRGILQINNYWHKEVPDSCAYDAECAFRQGFIISRGGTNFNAWAVYKGGQYKQYLEPVTGRPPGLASPPASGSESPAAGILGVDLSWFKPDRLAKLSLGVLLILAGIYLAGTGMGVVPSPGKLAAAKLAPVAKAAPKATPKAAPDAAPAGGAE